MSDKRTYYTADCYRFVETPDSPSGGFIYEIAFKPEEAIKLAAAILNRMSEKPTNAVRLMVRDDKKRVVVG